MYGHATLCRGKWTLLEEKAPGSYLKMIMEKCLCSAKNRKIYYFLGTHYTYLFYFVMAPENTGAADEWPFQTLQPHRHCSACSQPCFPSVV